MTAEGYVAPSAGSWREQRDRHVAGAGARMRERWKRKRAIMRGHAEPLLEPGSDRRVAAEVRELIDAALAAGKVVKIPMAGWRPRQEPTALERKGPRGKKT